MNDDEQHTSRRLRRDEGRRARPRSSRASSPSSRDAAGVSPRSSTTSMTSTSTCRARTRTASHRRARWSRWSPRHDEFAATRVVERERTLDEIAALAGDVDILIAEGFKPHRVPRIEVSRRERSEELVCRADELIALVTDHATLPGVPTFALDDAAADRRLHRAHVSHRRRAGLRWPETHMGGASTTCASA